MSQQVLDLRRSIQIVRRHRILVGVMVVIGIVIGCAYPVHQAADADRTALVVFPQSLRARPRPRPRPTARLHVHGDARGHRE